MRYAPLTGERRNIRELDYTKKNGRGGTHLWQGPPPGAATGTADFFSNQEKRRV